jgi:hypothetical protein
VVGDGDAVGIAGQVVKDVLRSAEGRLGIDDPVLLEQQYAEKLRSSSLLSAASTRRRTATDRDEKRVVVQQ